MSSPCTWNYVRWHWNLYCSIHRTHSLTCNMIFIIFCDSPLCGNLDCLIMCMPNAVMCLNSEMWKNLVGTIGFLFLNMMGSILKGVTDLHKIISFVSRRAALTFLFGSAIRLLATRLFHFVCFAGKTIKFYWFLGSWSGVVICALI